MLGAAATRLDVLWSREGLLALNKPAGVASEPHPFWPDAPDLRGALRQCAQRPSFTSYALNAPSGICHLDAELSGVALFGIDAEASARWRNVFGSRQLSFHYRLLTSRTDFEETFLCDLPLASHREKPLALVSHAQGKRTSTIFTRQERFGHFELWDAQTDYSRPHQIRLHATECGLNILGESLYSQTPEPLLSALKGGRFKKRDEEKPLYGSLCIHLSHVALPDSVKIEAPLPEKWALLEKKIREFS